MSCGVYAIINIVNGKMYIGSSKKLEGHCACYFHDLRKGVHGNLHLQRAFNKYGEKVFVLEILELTLECNQFEREQYYINLIGMDNLYNISPTAGGGFTGPVSAEVRRKISEACSGIHNVHVGISLSEETKEKISKAQKGIPRVPLSEAHKEKIGEACRGISRVPFSAEHKMKISGALKGVPRSPFSAQHKKKISRVMKGRAPWNKGMRNRILA